jgi:hypothetical protein
VSRKNVPDILGENVRNEKVDVLGGVGMPARVPSLDTVVVPGRGLIQNGFDLDAPERVLKANDYVIAITVAPGLGYCEAKGRRVDCSEALRCG